MPRTNEKKLCRARDALDDAMTAALVAAHSINATANEWGVQDQKTRDSMVSCIHADIAKMEAHLNRMKLLVSGIEPDAKEEPKREVNCSCEQRGRAFSCSRCA